ncbi:MAG: immune inhibitor A [Intrasporangium sp.]|uniref:immune inhibitor A domain-containing protein n=1 Tax=Intrasporangium sp. TaxID=1925024 RepID=UPI0026470F73|nr:immune inhibitor A domain-containing protein [Intrasporangium sp.]MDN5797525.1 immune inhibitor A [Intrasporangium sp.]
MNKRQWGAVSGLAVGALVASTLAAPLGAQAAPSTRAPISSDPAAAQASRPDNLPNPLAEAQNKLRQDAVHQLITGQATTRVINGNRVIELTSTRPAKGVKGKAAKARTRYVNYPVDREESIFTVLTDFGDKTDPRTDGEAGPAHNEIPQPDRVWDGNSTDDNSTYWIADFSRQHYLEMMFSGTNDSFRDFYLKQSNGRFLAKGDVSDWIQVPYNEARYGSNEIPESDGYWNYVKDTATAWYDAQVVAGKSPAQIRSYLSQFDKVDRYDYDGDGDFNEPDGYIDHFQAIHAGEGEEAGGGAQGADAIWSHRWYAFSTDEGRTGPGFNKLGGVPLGDSGIWIGDYTTEPENGGLGVFAHEFGHDLGLPDLYDTAGGDNGTGFWTLMSSGSWLSQSRTEIGTKPGYLGPWEKLQLGWLDYATVKPGKSRTVKLGPASEVVLDRSSRWPDSYGVKPQAVVVPLPARTLVTERNTPHSGTGEWWSGYGNDLRATLTRSLDLTGAGSSASVSAWVQGNLEVDYDYLYAEVSTDGGSTWAQVGDEVNGVFDWMQKSFDLTPWVGRQVDFRFRVATDGGVASEAFIDDIAVTVDGTAGPVDDVENGPDGWTADGFTIIDGTTSRQVQDVYYAENRTYTGYDKTLRKGPYNFGWASTKPNWVEKFPYQNGLLVWYSNGQYTNNNTVTHPGGGLILPVDARPKAIKFPGTPGGDAVLLGNRRQPFDATFGLERTDAVTFHRNGYGVYVRSSPGIRTFDDSNPNRYWDSANPMGSTKVAGAGVKVTVRSTSHRGEYMTVRVVNDSK